MQCKDCKSCKQGWFKSKPDDYVCIGVKEPFVIEDVEHECTEYVWTNIIPNNKTVYVKQNPYVGDDGIYEPINAYVKEGCASIYKCIMTKEMFVEAYNKWIKGEDNGPNRSAP